jgi:hypothetical protein
VSTESTPSAVSVITQAASGIPSDIANCINDGPTQPRIIIIGVLQKLIDHTYYEYINAPQDLGLDLPLSRSTL